MALSDNITRYRFTETEGPGCGVAAHPSSCLCDVRCPSVPAVLVVHLPCMQIVREMLTGQIDGAKFEAYMGTVLGLYEMANNILEGGVTVDDLEMARSEFLDVWSTPRGDATVKLPLLRAALDVYRTAGMTFRQIANHLRTDGLASGTTKSGLSSGGGPGAVTLVDVVRILNKGDETSDHCHKLALIEGHLRAGVETYAELMAMTGLTKDQVGHFAQRWGYKTLTQQRQEQGGGRKNSVEVNAMVRDLAGHGRTPTEILALVHEAHPESRDTLTYSSVAQTASRMRRRAAKKASA